MKAAGPLLPSPFTFPLAPAFTPSPFPFILAGLLLARAARLTLKPSEVVRP